MNNLDVGFYYKTMNGLGFKPLGKQGLKIGSSVTSDFRESSLPGFAASLGYTPQGECFLLILDPLASIAIDGVPVTGRIVMQIGSKLQIGGAVLQLGLNSPTLTTVNGPLDAESVAEPYVPPFAIAAPVVDFVEPPRRKKRILPIAIVFSAMLLIGVVILAIPIRKPLDSSVSSTPSGASPSGGDSESQMVVCSNCNGTGRTTCPSCGGGGRSGLRPGTRGEIMPQFINPSRGGSGYRGQLQESDSEIDSEILMC